MEQIRKFLQGKGFALVLAACLLAAAAAGVWAVPEGPPEQAVRDRASAAAAERDRIRFSFFMFGSSQSKIGAADGAGCKKTLLPHCWDKSVSTLLRYHPN